MYGDLIVQLHFFRIESGSQTDHVGVFRQVFGQRRRYRLGQRNTVQQRTEILQCAVIRQAARRHFIGHRQ